MRIDISGNKIYQLDVLGKRVKVLLTNGKEIIGTPDCLCLVGTDEDEDADEEVLKFDVEGGGSVFLTKEEVKSYSII